MALADIIVVLEDGKITEAGSPSCLRTTDGYVSKIGLESPKSQVTKPTTKTIETVVVDEGKKGVSPLKADEDKDDGEWRKSGNFSVYKYYLRSSSYTAVAVYAAFVTFWMFCTEFLSTFRTFIRFPMLPRLTKIKLFG